MKALVCELCAGNNIIKQDGYFVCQSCGTKYTLEEAKKMMIEGTVDIKGTVKVDTSDKIQNYYQIARRAKETGNNEEAGRYYDLILMEQPDSWEATFYTTYFSCMQTKNAGIGNAAIRMNNTVTSVLNMIEKITDIDKQIRAVEEVSAKALTIFGFLYEAQNNFYHSIPVSQSFKYTESDTITLNNCCTAIYNLGDLVKAKFPEKTYLATKIWTVGVTKERLLAYKPAETKASIAAREALIKKYDPSYFIM